MRRTSLVLAVVAAMVTVLVFAAPAFAVEKCPTFPADCPAGAPEGPSAGGPPLKHYNLQEGEGLTPGGASDPQGENCVGDQVTDEALFISGVGGPPGYHVLEGNEQIPGQIPGDAIQDLC